MLKFSEKHKELLSPTGKSLVDLQKLPDEERNKFIETFLLPYICGDGTEEQEELADDLLTMITVWEIGQTSE